MEMLNSERLHENPYELKHRTPKIQPSFRKPMSGSSNVTSNKYTVSEKESTKIKDCSRKSLQLEKMSICGSNVNCQPSRTKLKPPRNPQPPKKMTRPAFQITNIAFTENFLRK